MRSSASFVAGLAQLALISRVTVLECYASPSPAWTTVNVPGAAGYAGKGGYSDRAQRCSVSGYPVSPLPKGCSRSRTNGQSPTTRRRNRPTKTTQPGKPGETNVDIDPTDPTDPTDPDSDPVDDFDFEYSAFFDFRNVVAADGPTPWAPAWRARNWLRPATNSAPLELSYLPSEVYITNNSASALQARQNGNEPATYLTLRTQRLDPSTQAAAGLDYIDTVTTVSMSMLARVRGASGAVAGFFTYYNDTTESDIEVLTRDGNSQVRVSNQPTADPETGVPIPDASFNVSLSQGSTTNWNVYRLDLLEDRSDWYVNGELVASTTVNVPSGVDSALTLNMWSNGGGFTGEMALGREALLEVQWIELFYNSNEESNVGGGDGDGPTTTETETMTATETPSGTGPVTVPSAGPTGGGGSSNGTFKFRG